MSRLIAKLFRTVKSEVNTHWSPSWLQTCQVSSGRHQSGQACWSYLRKPKRQNRKWNPNFKRSPGQNNNNNDHNNKIHEIPKMKNYFLLITAFLLPPSNHTVWDTDRWPGCCWVAPRRRSLTAAGWPPCRARPCCWRPCLSACRWRPARQRWWCGGRCLLQARADWGWKWK